MVPGYIYKCPSQIFHMFGLPNYPWEAAMMVEGLVKAIRDASTTKIKEKISQEENNVDVWQLTCKGDCR